MKKYLRIISYAFLIGLILFDVLKENHQKVRIFQFLLIIFFLILFFYELTKLVKKEKE
jgi:hypothetical protein